MEKALYYRDTILKTIAISAEQFLRTVPDRTSIRELLQRLGESLNVSRVYIFENQTSPEGVLLTSQRYEWVAPGIEPQIENQALQELPFRESGFGRWEQVLCEGRLIFGVVSSFPESEQKILFEQSIFSLTVAPIFVRDIWWGFIGFDDCKEEREWPEPERDALKTAAGILGAAFQNMFAEERLKRAYDDMEKRVELRTAELANMVQTMRESQRAYRTLAENLPGIVYRISLQENNRMHIFNKTFPAITGYTVEELTELKGGDFCRIESLMIPEDVPKVRDAIRRAIEKSKPFTFEYRIRHKNGDIRYLVENGIPIYDSNDDPLFLDGVIFDISNIKKMEQEIIKIQKLESIGILAGGIAHDFNNLLQIILGNISLAGIHAKPGGRISERLQEAENACMKAQELSYRLLTFSKGGFPVKKLVSISKLLKDTVRFALSGSSIVSQLEFSDDLYLVEVDEGQMAQVFNDVLINAVEAMPDGGIITVKAENIMVKGKNTLPIRKGTYVKISIKDTGVGIPKENLPRIFDPYFTTKDIGSRKGSGLGLSICHSIIQKHNGYITVESDQRIGTTFHIYLPACEKQFLKEEMVNERQITKKRRILLMDDEQQLRRSVGEMLEYLGYEVEYAKDGDEGVDIYTMRKKVGKDFDAVILDLTIPGGMGGKQAIRKMLEVDPTVKGIVSSGYADDAIMTYYREYGFVGAIAKPYTLDTLKEILRKIVN